MPAPRIYRAEALILRASRSGEADRVLTIFRAGAGKARVLAKGVLRPTSHLAGHVEVLSRTSLLVARGRTMDIVTQAQTLESFAGIRDDLRRSAAALYAVELIDRISEPQDLQGDEAAEAALEAVHPSADNYRLYQLLLECLRWIAAADPDTALRYLEARLLYLHGYGPELQQCLSCGQPLKPELNLFSTAMGGTLCSDCWPDDPQAPPVTVNALKVLRLLQRGDLAQAQRLRLDPGLSREVELILRRYLPRVLERDLRSSAFVDAVRAGGRA